MAQRYIYTFLYQKCIMTSPNVSSLSPVLPETQIWDSLKQAIASSSGFQRWQVERPLDHQEFTLDYQVRRYLRETLETLAY
jgi:hypothetical protein